VSGGLVPIGELVESVNTWTPERAAPEGLFTYIDLTSVEQEEKRIVGPREVACAEAPSRARQLVKTNDVLVSTVRPNLNAVVIVPQELDGATASTGFCVLRARSRLIEAKYLFHWVRSSQFINEMVRRATGASYPAVSDRVVCESKIPLPPLPEQRRIAEILDKADALRAKRRGALTELDTLIQSIFLDMFGDPTEFDIRPLGDYLQFVTSGARGWAKYYAQAGSRFIRSLDVRMNRIGDDEAAFVSPPDNAEARRTRVQAEDVLLTITGSRIGRVSPAPKRLEGAYISQHVAILRLDKKRMEPSFLSYFLSLGSGGQRQITKAQYGQTKPGLNFEQIRQFQIPVPSVTSQREFVQRMKAVRHIEAMQQSSSSELNALFTSIQHRAFREEL
jgi:type I restriction enzyme, S subunit